MIPEIEKPLPDENEAARIKKIALIRVVDDDAGMLRSYKFMFSSQGWNVKCYSDAASFLEEEVELTKKIFPKTWKGPDSSFYGKNKKDFFDKCFNVRKK